MVSQDSLFHRLNIEEEIVFDNAAPLSTGNNRNNNHSSSSSNNSLLVPLSVPAGEIIGALGGALEQADQALDELTSNDLLGTAIFRSCRDVADAVGHLADRLENQSEDDRRALANACLQDVQEATQQQSQQIAIITPTPEMQELSTMTEDDIMSALSGASTLLRDVEMGLRGIEKEEAEDIADCALTLARLFLASLHTFHATLAQEEEDKRQLAEEDNSNRFELLDDDGQENLDDGVIDDGRKSKASSQRKKSRNDRLRVLWPPLGPAVATAFSWGKDEAVKQPILAVALGMTMWPAAVVTTLIGAPFVITDNVVQHAYNSFQDGPIVSNIEKGAAQVFQAGKLSLLCGKLVARQSLRVLNRQIDRNGGIEQLLQNLGGILVDRIMHPADTVSTVWGGLQWGFGMLHENWQNLTGNDEERRDALAAGSGEW